MNKFEKYKLWLGIIAMSIFICSYSFAELIFPVDVFDRLSFVSTVNSLAFSLILIVARFGTSGMTRFFYSLGIGLSISYSASRLINPIEEFRFVDVVMILITSFVVFYDFTRNK